MSGLQYLVENYRSWHIDSLAVPPLGCGNGQLEWNVIGPTLYGMLCDLKIDVEFYAPRGTPNEQLTLDFLSQSVTQPSLVPSSEARIPTAWIALVDILCRIEQTPTRQPIGRIMFQMIAYLPLCLAYLPALIFAEALLVRTIRMSNAQLAS